MNLPTYLSVVTYRVAGSVTYVGDLVVTENVVYYFPRAELAGLFYTVGYLGWGLLWAIVGFAMLIATPKKILEEIFKNTAESAVQGLIRPHTREGKAARQEAVSFQTLLTEVENSYPNTTLEAEYLYPIITYPALWYPLVLDASIYQTNSISTESLPKPVRLAKSAIKRTRLTALGKLIIETEFDMNHTFRLGFIGRRKARKALSEGHYFV